MKHFARQFHQAQRESGHKKIQVYKYGHLGASNYNLTTWGVHNKKMHILNFDILILKKIIIYFQEICTDFTRGYKKIHLTSVTINYKNI